MNDQPRRCGGPSRREVLRVGSLGFLGLGLDEWFRLRAQAEEGDRDGAGSRGKTPAKSSAQPKAKNCILIWLAGGPSHLDTFDPKPKAPADVRGEFKPIATSVPGLEISEVLPNLAKVMNRVTLIRSMTSPESDHGRASQHLLTGYRPSPAHRVSGLRQRRGQGTRGEARDAAAVCRCARCADRRRRAATSARRTTRSPPPATPTSRASGSRT